MLMRMRWRVFGLAVAALLLVVAVPAESRRAGVSFCKTESVERVEARATKAGAQDIALALKGESLRPGETASARLFNRGESNAAYGLAVKIERWMDGQWSLGPSSPKGPWPKKLGRLDPGEISACFRFPVPDGQPGGQYRFTVYIHLDQKKVRRSAKFIVHLS